MRLSGRAAAVGAAALIAAGLWVSLHYARAAWKADPDIFVTVELWRGVLRHGLPFLATWSYTEDNWLLSLLPLASLAYAAFGATPAVAVTLGWGIFVASVALTAALVWRLAGRWPAALTAGALLFANYYASGPSGFLTYPISHGVSMAWGLAILLLAYEGLERRSYGLCVLAGLLVFPDALSDPWATVAIGIPVALTAGALALVNGRTRLAACAGALSLSALVAAYVAYKHPFGLFGFLQREHFQRGGAAAWAENLRLGYRSLALSYNILPGGDLEAATTRALSFGALLAVMVLAGALALWGLRRGGPGRRLVVGAAALSLGGVTVAYLLGPKMDGIYVARFFPNLFFLGAVLAALAAAEARGRGALAIRAAVGGYAALFVAAGAASSPHAWQAPLVPAAPQEAVGLAAFLRDHGLTYGYGQFWGSRALTMETLSDGAVIIRPITYAGERITARPAEASSLWFRPEAEPKGRPVFLHIVPDGTECAVTADCEAIARRQFGEPASRLTSGPDVVLVWNHPLVPLIDPPKR